MNIGEACAIFRNIEDESISTMKKVRAVHEVVNMATHNGITKAEMLRVLKWAFGDGFGDGVWPEESD